MLYGLVAAPQLDWVTEPAAERVVAFVAGVVAASLSGAEGSAGFADLQQGELELSRGHAGTSLGVHGVLLPSSLR